MDTDQELVRKITQAVLEALGHIAPAPAAEVKPPVGICTGDYSKFPELAGKIGTHRPATDGAIEPAAGVAEINGPVLTGVVTAGRLAGAQGTVFLSDGAQLSPLAMDVARERNLTIQRVGTAEIKKPVARWVWWMQGFCPSAQRLVDRFAAPPPEGVNGTSAGQLSAAIGKISQALTGGKASHGVLFVPDGTAALCLANKVRALRAIAGASPNGVTRGISQTGANVLVLEYANHDYQAMNEMLTRFLSSSPRMPAGLERQLCEIGV